MPDQDEPDMAALREATAALRRAMGMTVNDMHAQSGIARSMLFRIENGTAAGSLTTWYRIAKALDVPLSDLVKHLDPPRDR